MADSSSASCNCRRSSSGTASCPSLRCRTLRTCVADRQTHARAAVAAAVDTVRGSTVHSPVRCTGACHYPRSPRNRSDGSSARPVRTTHTSSDRLLQLLPLPLRLLRLLLLLLLVGAVDQRTLVGSARASAAAVPQVETACAAEKTRAGEELDGGERLVAVKARALKWTFRGGQQTVCGVEFGRYVAVDARALVFVERLFVDESVGVEDVETARTVWSGGRGGRGEEGEEEEEVGEAQETTCSARDGALADGAKVWRHMGQEGGVEYVMMAKVRVRERVMVVGEIVARRRSEGRVVEWDTRGVLRNTTRTVVLAATDLCHELVLLVNLDKSEGRTEPHLCFFVCLPVRITRFLKCALASKGVRRWLLSRIGADPYQ